MRFNIKRRLLYILFGSGAFLAAYYVGSAVEMSEQDAATLRDEFSDLIKDIDEYGIFVNNVRIALAMFIPGFGAGFGVFSGFSTGMVFSALAEDIPALENVSPLIILITPFGIMEVFSYGLAMSRSGMLIVFFYRLAKKRVPADELRPTLIKTGIEIGIVVAILLAGAIIEWQMIEQFGGIDEVTI